MNLLDFLTERREDYLKALHIAAGKFFDHPKYEPFFEVLNEREEHSNTGGYLSALFRHDILLRSKDGAYYDFTINVPPIVFSSPETCQLDGSLIILESFVLNGCQIKLSHCDLNKKILVDWHNKRIVPDSNQLNKEPVNAVHNIHVDDKNSVVTVDFGTIPSSRIIDFFNLLLKSGQKQLTINASYQ